MDQNQDKVKATTAVLVVRVLNYYGRITIVPESDTAKKFAKLLGQKTLTEENIKIIKELGYEVKTREEKL